MNNDRRKRLEKAVFKLKDVKSIVEECQSEEQDYYDNMPEGLQNSQKGEKASSAADALQEAVDQVSDAIDKITEASE